jgi:FkbM family methyltransferase
MTTMDILKALAYGALDVCTLGRGVPRAVCGERVRIPARWHRWYPDEYEPETFAFLRARCEPGATVMDIGAHLGVFTILMARLVGASGRVFSFEPTPQTRAVLSEMLRLNGLGSPVEVRGEAVSGSNGTATFFHTGASVSCANSLVRTARSRGGVEVPTVRLDDFTSERGLTVGCLKIDVEGAELNLLRGARRTFLTGRPAAALSLHPDAVRESGGSLDEVWDLLREYRMSVRPLNRPGSPGDGSPEAVGKEWFVRQDGLFDVALDPLP